MSRERARQGGACWGRRAGDGKLGAAISGDGVWIDLDVLECRDFAASLRWIACALIGGGI